MTKQDYLNELNNQLNKNNVPDVDEITAEYEQHFLFKLADGFTEDEIAQKLGAPENIAAQFAQVRGDTKPKKGKKVFLVLWLTIIGIFEVMLYVAFLWFIVAMFCASLVPAILGVELIAGMNVMNILPPMPYGAAVIFGIMLLSLCILLVVAALYCLAYLRQMVRASLRWRKNMLNDEALPPLPFNPQFSPKAKRAIRAVFLWALLIFGITFVSGFAILVVYTQSWGFWHALGWFGYPATIH